MDAEDLYCKALRKCSVNLQNKLNLEVIVPYLMRENMLTTTDEHMLADSNKSRTQKINAFIPILPTKGSGWWEKFVKVLKSTTTGTAHNELADELEHQLAELIVDNGKYICNHLCSVHIAFSM